MKVEKFWFFKSLFKDGWKKTMQRWKYNYLTLDSPDWLLKKEIMTYVAMLFGTLFVDVMLLMSKNWYIGIPLIFVLLLQYFQLRSKIIQLNEIKKVLKEAGEMLNAETKQVPVPKGKEQ